MEFPDEIFDFIIENDLIKTTNCFLSENSQHNHEEEYSKFENRVRCHGFCNFVILKYLNGRPSIYTETL